MARSGNLIIGLVPGPAASPLPAADPQPDAEEVPPPVDPIAVAVWVLCLILIITFGVLATFFSPIFFLAVVLTFIPLAVVASRSS